MMSWRRILYNLMYRFGTPRWDTSITPPELVEVIEGAAAIPAGRALAQGVPQVCLPGLDADQSIIAGRVEALGAGKALPGQAEANELRSAIEQVLATPAYREAAKRLARLIRREDGAANGASALEACVA